MDMHHKSLKKTTRSYSSAGFTLVEFMIVLAIIQILGALAAPMYADYKKKVKWTENINLAYGIAKQAMTCVQMYGTSCSGAVGYMTPQDIGLGAWPSGKYISQIDVFFAGEDGGFHVVIVGTAEVGGYRYDRGYSKQPQGGYMATQSWRDNVPDYLVKTWPTDGF